MVSIGVELQRLPVQLDASYHPLMLQRLAQTQADEERPFVLLESGEPGSDQKQQSMLFFEPVLSVRLTNDGYTLIGHDPLGRQLTEKLRLVTKPDTGVANDVIDEAERLAQSPLFGPLRRLMRCFRGKQQDMRHCYFVGAFAFDLAAQAHRIALPSDNDVPLLDLTLYRFCLHVNHIAGRAELRQTVLNFENEGTFHHGDALAASAVLAQIHNLVVNVRAKQAPENDKARDFTATPSLALSMDDEQYGQMVTRAKRSLRAGEVFQIVLARAFETECPNPYLAYQRLCQQNPSPYQFFIQQDGRVLFGASPERALKVEMTSQGWKARLYPIAGTRARGLVNGVLDSELDERRECALRTDAKEQAEHLMLVDLARNDLARVARGSNRRVIRLLDVDRYSKVMHLVSEVEATLAPPFDALAAFEATMHMGTLIGAPKPRALELIYQYEQHSRGFYGGAVGHINLAGELDTAIVIRSAEVNQGKARVMAGAGIVLDSDPRHEAEETRIKASAVLSALGVAL
ncbi:MAG: anthranilate synthase component 1 [Gammaproteobacteria bacterium]|nr:MAG: anthranilate synthase component 1 [Gammaproteobacteria bacterium]